MLAVRVIDGPASWDALAADWNALLARSATNSVFLTHEWLSAWWRAFAAADERLHVVVVLRDGRLCAAAPLLARTTRRMGVRVRWLRSLSNPHTPRYDWLCAPDDREAWNALFDAVLDGTRWDALRMDYVPADSPTVAALRDAAKSGRARVRDEFCIGSPYLAIGGTWDEYYNSLSGKFRSNTRYAERKLRELGELRRVEQQAGDDLVEALRRAYAVEQTSWKGDAGTAIADHAEQMRFYDEVAVAAAKHGWFHLYFLELGDRPIAFDYCLDYDGTMSLVKIGYDPEFGKHSPGSVLRMQVLEELFAQGRHREYDMLGSATDWKLRLSRDVRELRSAWVFPKRWRGRVAYEMEFGVADRVEGRPALKRLLRGVRDKLGGA